MQIILKGGIQKIIWIEERLLFVLVLSIYRNWDISLNMARLFRT